MEDKIVKSSEIRVKVGLNVNNLPIGMKWTATDGDIVDAPAKAMMLSMWDHSQNNTMKIDLWTKDMSIEGQKVSRLDYSKKLLQGIMENRISVKI